MDHWGNRPMVKKGTKLYCSKCFTHLVTVRKDIVGSTRLQDIGKKHLKPPQKFIMVECPQCGHSNNIYDMLLAEDLKES